MCPAGTTSDQGTKSKFDCFRVGQAVTAALGTELYGAFDVETGTRMLGPSGDPVPKSPEEVKEEYKDNLITDTCKTARPPIPEGCPGYVAPTDGAETAARRRLRLEAYANITNRTVRWNGTAWTWPLFMSVAMNVRPATMEHK